MEQVKAECAKDKKQEKNKVLRKRCVRTYFGRAHLGSVCSSDMKNPTNVL